TATPCDGSPREGGVDDNVIPSPGGIVRKQEQNRGTWGLDSPLSLASIASSRWSRFDPSRSAQRNFDGAPLPGASHTSGDRNAADATTQRVGMTMARSQSSAPARRTPRCTVLEGSSRSRAPAEAPV